VSSVKEALARLPNLPGVYVFKNAAGEVLYVGKAASLKTRVSSYFRASARDPKTAQMVEAVASVDHQVCDSEIEALLLEAETIKRLNPRYNVDLKDDKSFPVVAVTKEPFPTVLVTRDRTLEADYYGPFVEAKELRRAMDALQRVFMFRNCRQRIDPEQAALKRKRPCLLYHIGRCSAPCAGEVSVEEYARQIKDFRRFMKGGRRAVVGRLRKRMHEAAKALQFEKAGRLRDKIHALSRLARALAAADGAEATAPETEGAAERLTEILRLPGPPRLIEGVDVAVLQGSDAVGVVVTFLEGEPFKDGYRRYRIKRADRRDDVGMIGEVVYRRFRRKREEDAPIPDILLVDGGRGQLSAAQRALERVGLAPAAVVALAKRREELYVLGRREPVLLERTDAALKLLQYVRDEAHRFAQHYHKSLRRRRVFGGKRRGRTRGKGE